jgi:hypothetical protein
MWNERWKMAPKEWDLQRKTKHGIGTEQEQDWAWGNGMDMGTGMKTRLNQTFEQLHIEDIHTRLIQSNHHIVPAQPLASIKSPTGITLEIKVIINELNVKCATCNTLK